MKKGHNCDSRRNPTYEVYARCRWSSSYSPSRHDACRHSDGAHQNHLQHETESMVKKIEQLESSKRKLLGEGLTSCSIEELLQLEQQLERSVSCIRSRKIQVYHEQIEQLKEKEKLLEAENLKLMEKCGVNPEPVKPKEASLEIYVPPRSESSENSDVETELFIGPPETRTTAYSNKIRTDLKEVSDDKKDQES